MKILTLSILLLSSLSANADITIKHGWKLTGQEESDNVSNTFAATISPAQKNKEASLDLIIGRKNYIISKSLIDKTGLSMHEFIDLCRSASNGEYNLRIDLFVNEESRNVREIQYVIFTPKLQ